MIVAASRPAPPPATRSDRRPRGRSTLRSVAIPTEHGGWGLTLEPAMLGLIVAPSVAGVCLAAAALLAFTARTPLKIALVDRRRGRSLPRTTVAWWVASIELAVIGALAAVAGATAEGAVWVPAVAAVPFLAVEGWYDIRSRGRRLVPELAGAIGVSSVAAMVLLAGGADGTVAGGASLVLSARAVASIPWVRTQIARLHGRSTSAGSAVAADAAALLLAVAAVAVDRRLLAGGAAVVAVIVAQRLMARASPVRPVVVGMRQMGLGVAVALTTAIGVLTGG